MVFFSIFFFYSAGHAYTVEQAYENQATVIHLEKITETFLIFIFASQCTRESSQTKR